MLVVAVVVVVACPFTGPGFGTVEISNSVEVLNCGFRAVISNFSLFSMPFVCDPANNKLI